MQHRTSEWMEVTSEYQKYHESQWDKPYSSTIKFCDWLDELRVFNPNDSLRICDVGSGGGANLYYMAKRYPNFLFKGIDINPNLVVWGNKQLKSRFINNASLEVGDLYDFPQKYKDNFDGIVSLQTLSWLPEYRTPLEKMISLNPQWIAITSLFFDGEVNCKIEIEDYTQPLSGKPFKEAFYNIYPIKLIKELFIQRGYSKFMY
ncbi:MAG: class I SAM-dependent methyltransferase, partial [Sedimentisphaerales bacterium]